MVQASLKGKVIAITGAASGIANATARACAESGANLALADLNINVLNDVVKELKQQYPELEIAGTKLDVTDSSAVDAWVASVMEQFGRIDGAANIAGVEGPPGGNSYAKMVDMTDEHWKFVLDINLSGVFYCVRAQLRVMKRGSSIVNAASTAGLRGGIKLAAYTSSKHGVVGLTKTASKEAGPDGIRVNAICPGPIDTPLLRRIFDTHGISLEQVEQNTALQRLGKVEEVAKAFCHLLSDDSSWINGTTITLDGGSMFA